MLVNNAAHQMSFNAPDEISDEEWERTFAVNISAMFYLVKSGDAAHAPGQHHHQHGLDQFRQPESAPAGLCHH